MSKKQEKKHAQQAGRQSPGVEVDMRRPAPTSPENPPVHSHSCFPSFLPLAYGPSFPGDSSARIRSFYPRDSEASVYEFSSLYEVLQRTVSLLSNEIEEMKRERKKDQETIEVMKGERKEDQETIEAMKRERKKDQERMAELREESQETHRKVQMIFELQRSLQSSLPPASLAPQTPQPPSFPLLDSSYPKFSTSSNSRFCDDYLPYCQQLPPSTPTVPAMPSPSSAKCKPPSQNSEQKKPAPSQLTTSSELNQKKGKSSAKKVQPPATPIVPLQVLLSLHIPLFRFSFSRKCSCFSTEEPARKRCPKRSRK